MVNCILKVTDRNTETYRSKFRQFKLSNEREGKLKRREKADQAPARSGELVAVNFMPRLVLLDAEDAPLSLGEISPVLALEFSITPLPSFLNAKSSMLEYPEHSFWAVAYCPHAGTF
jgi:hypothetical protein